MRNMLGDAVFAVLLVILAFAAFLVFKEWDLVWGMAFGR